MYSLVSHLFNMKSISTNSNLRFSPLSHGIFHFRGSCFKDFIKISVFFFLLHVLPHPGSCVTVHPTDSMIKTTFVSKVIYNKFLQYINNSRYDLQTPLLLLTLFNHPFSHHYFFPFFFAASSAFFFFISPTGSFPFSFSFLSLMIFNFSS